MIIVPAPILGILAIMVAAFAVGFGITALFFHLTRSRWPAIEKRQNDISIAVGAILALFSLVIVFEYTRNSQNNSAAWLVLTIAGFAVSALSFIILFIVSSGGDGTTTSHTRHSGNPVSSADVEKLDNDRNKAEKQRQKYIDRHYKKIQKKRKAIAGLIDRWMNVFSRVPILGDLCRSHFLRRLANSLNDLVPLSSIKVVDPLQGPSNDENENVRNSISGIVDIDGKQILLAIISLKRPLDRKGISPFIVQLHNRSLSIMIIYLDSLYENSAHSTCKEVAEDKVIALCNLTELSASLAGKGSLKQHFLETVAMWKALWSAPEPR